MEMKPDHRVGEGVRKGHTISFSSLMPEMWDSGIGIRLLGQEGVKT